MNHRVDPIHHDGHGLNDLLDIYADERDTKCGGGASHHYQIGYQRNDDTGWSVANIQFQHGPRNVAGSTPGTTEAALYVVLIDRLEAFQAGPFACQSNEDQLVCLREALRLTNARADERADRGVLGRNEK